VIDFLIIGGGIAGTSAAARLAPLGQVTVLEGENALGYHASGRSAALFEQNYGSPSTIALNRASRAYHDAAEVLSPRGLLLLGSPGNTEAFAADKTGMEMNEITLAEARAMVPILHPDTVTRAAYHAEALDIDTDKLLQGYARTARSHGAQIITDAKVSAITKTAQGWAVTAGETYEARILINAAGPWVDEIATLAGIAQINTTPYRRSMARIPAPDGHDVRAWPMLFGPGETWYAKPDAGALIVSPADEDATTPHDAWADDMILAMGIARYQEVVTVEVTRMIGNWAGLRTFAPDRSLVIGFEPTDPTFFWLAGQGGYGMQSSPAASQLTADLIAGKTPEIDAKSLAALDPSRFRT
jgi:glycine/D-amino acid oxidase-like deaminating enzyme